MLFLLHVVGVEGLYGVGFELVVAMEGGVEAEELLGVEVNDCVNQLFGNALFQAEQECAVGDGKEFFAGDGFGFDVAGQSKTGFEEDFIEQLFWCCLGVNMVDVERELIKNSLRRS